MPRQPGIFGTSPQSTIRKQDAALMRQYGSLPLGTALGVQGGASLGRAIGYALGYEDPEVQRARLIQEAEQATRARADINSNNFMDVAVEELSKRGLYDEAMRGKQQSLQLQKQQYEIDSLLGPDAGLHQQLKQFPQDWTPYLFQANQEIDPAIRNTPEGDVQRARIAADLRSGRRTVRQNVYTDRGELLSTQTREYENLTPAQSMLLRSQQRVEAGDPLGLGRAETTPALSSGRSNFVSSLSQIASQAAQALGTDAATVLAVAAHETGFGQRAPGNNFFGIKGKGQTFTTHEVIDGKRVKLRDNFRAYEAPQGSFNDFASLIQRRYPNAVGKSGLEFFKAMKAGGYATDPEYVKKLSNVYNQIAGTSQQVPTQTPVQQQQEQAQAAVQRVQEQMNPIISGIMETQSASKISPRTGSIRLRPDEKLINRALGFTEVMAGVNELARLVAEGGTVLGAGAGIQLPYLGRVNLPPMLYLKQDPEQKALLESVHASTLDAYRKAAGQGTVDEGTLRLGNKIITNPTSFEAFINGGPAQIKSYAAFMKKLVKDAQSFADTNGVEVAIPDFDPTLKYFMNPPRLPKKVRETLNKRIEEIRTDSDAALAPELNVFEGRISSDDAARRLLRLENPDAFAKFASQAANIITRVTGRPTTPAQAMILLDVPLAQSAFQGTELNDGSLSAPPTPRGTEDIPTIDVRPKNFGTPTRPRISNIPRG